MFFTWNGARANHAAYLLTRMAPKHTPLQAEGRVDMKLSLRYMYTKTLSLEADARIVDEHVAPLNIEWVGVASTRFASHAGFLYFVTDEIGRASCRERV